MNYSKTSAAAGVPRWLAGKLEAEEGETLFYYTNEFLNRPKGPNVQASHMWASPAPLRCMNGAPSAS